MRFGELVCPWFCCLTHAHESARNERGNEEERKLALCLECGPTVWRSTRSDFSINHDQPAYTIHLVVFISPLFGQFSSKTAQDGEQVIPHPFASAVMARSEIDDIFAAKKSMTKVIAQPEASTSTCTNATGSKKKKKDKKRKRQTEDVQDPSINEEQPQKKRVVETIRDPSALVPSVPSSKTAVKTGKDARTATLKTAKKEKEDLNRFKDSRGTGPRMWKFFSRDIRLLPHRKSGRKTEEGFGIFKEAELGINPEAGGTWSPTSSSTQN